VEENPMKRTLSRLVPFLLPACMVDTPAPENAEDRLGAELGSWCESICVKSDDCGGNDDPEACVDACVEYFRETYSDQGDVCEEAAGRVMDCLESASCEVLTSGNACNITAEETRCSGSVGLVACQASFGSATANGTPLQCEMGFDECSDGKTYRLTCSGPGDPPDCTCTTDGVVTGRFEPSRRECPFPEEASQICGWPFSERGHRPTTCQGAASSGVAGGAGVNECEISFGDCSDGNEYAVDCAGPPGAVLCTCEVNGVPLGSFESAAGICDHADLDNGSTAANYGCGFNLAPFGP